MSGKYFIILIALISGFTLRAQKPRLVTFGNDSAKVRQCDTLYYFGLDLSRLRVTDEKMIPRGPKYSTVCPKEWIRLLEAEISPNSIRRKMEKAAVIYNSSDVQFPCSHLPPDFITGLDYSFPLDTVVSSVKSYRLTPREGVGLVLIAENFNRPTGKAFIYITFFDIKSRKILWGARMAGHGKGATYKGLWGSGMVNAVNRFFRIEVTDNLYYEYSQ